jgi:predicted PurR-regulated permease PerM
MGFYWLTAREQILNLLLRLSPLSRRSYVELIWNDVEKTLCAYVRDQVILIVVIGVAAYVGLVILGIPYAPALAIIAGLTEAIPLVGPFLGAIPAVLVGFTISPTTGLLIAGWYLLIQQLEGNILVPKIMEHQVGLNPLLVMIALIAGGTLNGMVGALLAVPIAGALQVIVRHLLIDPTLKSNAPQVENGIVIFDADKREEITELKYVVVG